jgi:hypothetical protein
MNRTLLTIAGLIALALMVMAYDAPTMAQNPGHQGSSAAPAAQSGESAAPSNPGSMMGGSGMMGGGPGMMRGQHMMAPCGPCPCMGSGPMGYMRGPGSMGMGMHGMGMGMMNGPEMLSDPKTRGEMMEIRGRMLKEMGDLMERRGKEIAAGKK